MGQRQSLPASSGSPGHRPHPHPAAPGLPELGGRVRVRRRENAPHQRAPRRPLPQGPPRESLLRTPGVSLGTPTSRRRREPPRGRGRAGKEPAPESQSGEPGPGPLGIQTDTLTGLQKEATSLNRRKTSSEPPEYFLLERNESSVPVKQRLAWAPRVSPERRGAESCRLAKSAPAQCRACLLHSPRPQPYTTSSECLQQDLAEGTPGCEKATVDVGLEVCWGSRWFGETN